MTLSPVKRAKRKEQVNVNLGELLPRVATVANGLGVSIPDVIRMAVRSGLPARNDEQKQASEMARRALEAAL